MTTKDDAEQVEQTATDEVTTDEAEAETEQAAEQEPDWEAVAKALDKAPPDFIRKHSRFQGILGSEQQRLRMSWEQDRQAQDERAATEKAEKELLDLARENPIEFAEKYLTTKEAEILQNQIAKLKSDTAHNYMRQIGTSFGQQFNLSEDDVAEIAKELAGKNEDEVLPTFNVAATKIVANREAQKLFDQWRDKELTKERDALKQEVAADMLKKEPTPSMRKSSLPANVKPHQLPDKEFDEFYEKEVLGRASRFS